MKTIAKTLSLLLLVILAAALFSSCKNNYPSSIYDPNAKYNPDPTITDVNPKFGLAGIDTITITGKNFSSNPAEDNVFFNGEKAEVISASTTAITVKAPNVPSDSVQIKINVKGALLFGQYSYIKLEYASVEYGGFDNYDNASGLACDTDENIYVVLTTRKIIKVTPQGEKQDYGTASFIKATGMKMGPGGYLYMLRGNRTIYRVPPGGGHDEKFINSVGGRIYDLDFDQNGVLYVAGKADSIISVKPDGSFFGATPYVDYFLWGVRVYNGYVYVVGQYSGSDATIPKIAIWRNQITSNDGKLGPKELVFNWTSFAAGSDAIPLSITFSEKGELFIGASEGDAITIYSMDSGTTHALYPGVIYPPTNYMVWGNSNYLYVNRHNEHDAGKRRIMRYTMKENGAPYYGRK